MIKTETDDIQKNVASGTFLQEIPSFHSQVPPLQAACPKNDLVVNPVYVAAEGPNTELVVFEDEAKNIKEQLTNGSKKLLILAIVGMPGIGKTTLADSIFENHSVTRPFHARARCCVTQVYEKRRLLVELLQQVTNESQTEDYKEGRDIEDLEHKLSKSLKGQKYLILLDDIWDISAWNDIKSCFPVENKGSRIIFTSRFEGITSQVRSKCITYPLYPLSDEKSWDMLRIKLFPTESCPGELVKIGQRIAKNCRGLPLAVDLVAGILRMGEQKEDCWRKVAENLTRKLLNDEGRCKNIIGISYDHLPYHLRPCFLYFGAFPEDANVPTRKLIWMWIAEGFVQLQNAEKRSLEYVAETYLHDLIARSLVTVSEINSLFEVKSSRVHDLLREFALEKAKENRFLEQIKTDALSSTSSSCGYTVYEQYRLCICGDWRQFEGTNPSGPLSHSLIFHGPACEIDGSSLNSFPHLRVLDLRRIKIDNFPGVISLIHLKFLAVRSADNNIITKLQNLQNLETFMLKRSMDADGLLVVNFRDLKRLRHFRLSCPCIINAEEMEFVLESLQTLSTARVTYGEATEKTMRKFPNLRRLNCSFVCDNYDNGCPKLDSLSELESLTASYSGCNIPCPWKFSFPVRLKKLTLSGFRLPWSEISVIAKLEHLEVLKFKADAFVGEIWDMGEDKFSKLKFLSLSIPYVEEWIASENHLPRLVRLTVVGCTKLKSLPLCLGNIATLRIIELHGCSPTTGTSALEIKENQKEMGNEDLLVAEIDNSCRIM